MIAVLGVIAIDIDTFLLSFAIGVFQFFFRGKRIKVIKRRAKSNKTKTGHDNNY